MLLLRGATENRPASAAVWMFQYMLLLRGATRAHGQISHRYRVSIHAPLARSNLPADFPRNGPDVSIHAPLARSNPSSGSSSGTVAVSIHAPLARSNLKRITSGKRRKSFNTCSSCEEQPAGSFALDITLLLSFNTCSSCEEQPGGFCGNRDSDSGFNTCSSCEEQRHSNSSSSVICRFNTCSSCEEQLMSCREL